MRLALDTGSAITLINPGILSTVGYDLALATQRAQITTGSGFASVPVVRIDRIDALGQTRSHMPILAHALPPSAPIDGLLGLDFFRALCLTLDFRAGQITLT